MGEEGSAESGALQELLHEDPLLRAAQRLRAHQRIGDGDDRLRRGGVDLCGPTSEGQSV